MRGVLLPVKNLLVVLYFVKVCSLQSLGLVISATRLPRGILFITLGSYCCLNYFLHTELFVGLIRSFNI